jgi:predicted ATPase
MGSPRSKFAQLKQNLAAMFTYDKVNPTEQANFIPDLQEFFKDFFYPKEFLGVELDRSLRWRFPVRIDDGTHDIDSLSAGEKEILMTYATLLKLKKTRSVILFDEPELHLNAALERKVITSLNKLVDAGNQIWIATHSLEIINSVPLDKLFKVYPNIVDEKTG